MDRAEFPLLDRSKLGPSLARLGPAHLARTFFHKLTEGADMGWNDWKARLTVSIGRGRWHSVSFSSSPARTEHHRRRLPARCGRLPAGCHHLAANPGRPNLAVHLSKLRFFSLRLRCPLSGSLSMLATSRARFWIFYVLLYLRQNRFICIWILISSFLKINHEWIDVEFQWLLRQQSM
jgi:hypothetical protein